MQDYTLWDSYLVRFPRYQGVIVHSMADLPIGFGVAAKATSECRHADPMNIVAFHQVDKAVVSFTFNYCLIPGRLGGVHSG